MVGAAIVDDLARPGRLLAARRTRPVETQGLWELPGGKVEPGEAPQQALHRELVEELGVELRLGDELPGPDDGCWPISARLTMRVWLAELSGGAPTPDDAHDAVRWLTAASLDDVPWVPADVPVVDVLRTLLLR
ncbi:(deoxy)nucleoside triphosphate pyrophosphohydrolase [Angustibacter luteus]